MTKSPQFIVPNMGEPDIDDSYVRGCDPVVLETLLLDRSMTAANGGTRMFIKWAAEVWAMPAYEVPTEEKGKYNTFFRGCRGLSQGDCGI